MRFVLHCYVCEGGKLHFVHSLGSWTLGQILVARPVHCRYAVATEATYHDVWVIDMYLVVPDDFSALRLSSQEIYPDLDTAIAATILRNT